MKRLPTILVVLALAIPLIGATAPDIQAASCAECGMYVKMTSSYSAKIETGDDTVWFCDIGDLLVYVNRKSLALEGALVKDHESGEWISAEKAFYVQSESDFRTPMGWAIAAFKTRKAAETRGKALDGDAARRLVK